MRLTAAVLREGNWYVARCLEVEVASQGRTLEEALANLQEALELHFEDVPAVSFCEALCLEAGDTLSAHQVGGTFRLTEPEDPVFALWQHAETEYAEGRTVSLEEFGAPEGIDLNAPEDARAPREQSLRIERTAQRKPY